MTDVLGTIESCYEYGSLLYDYASKVKDAPEERRAYMDQVKVILESLRPLKQRFQDFCDSREPIPEAFYPIIKPHRRFVPKPKPQKPALGTTHRLFYHFGSGDDSKDEASSKASAEGSWVEDGTYEAAGVLLALEKDLAKLTGKLKPEEGAKEVVTRLIWYWKDPAVNSILENMKSLRVEIEHLIQVDRDEHVKQDRVDLKRVKYRVDRIDEREEYELRQKQRRKIIQWLSPLQSIERQGSILKDTFPVSSWLTDSNEFKIWLNGKPRWLWCYGEPGAGKTVLAAQVIKHLSETRIEKGALLLGLFFDYKEIAMQTMENLLGSLVRQIVQRQNAGVRSEKLKQMYAESGGETKPRAQDLIDVLKDEFAQASQVYLVLDGWDGIADKLRSTFESDIRELWDDGSKVRVAVFARYSEDDSRTMSVECRSCKTRDIKMYHYCPLCNDMDFCDDCTGKGHSCGRSGHEMLVNDRVHMLVKADEADILRYIEWEMERTLTTDTSRRINPRIGTINLSSTPLDRTLSDRPDLKQLIPKVIAKKSNGSLQYAKLYIDSIKLLPTIKDISTALQELPEDLPGIYKLMMSRFAGLKPTKRAKKLMEALHWISVSERPLSFAALQHAIAVEAGTAELEDDDLIREETIVLDSSGVINISHEGAVRMNLTMHEWLREHWSEFFAGQDMNIAVKLLTYLNFDELSIPCSNDVGDEIDDRLSRLPLLKYACQYWAGHVRPVISNEQVRSELLKFLARGANIESCLQVAYSESSKLFSDFDIRKGANGLHLAAIYGFDVVIEDLIRRHNIDVNSTDPKYGQTALIYAAENGHLGSVEILLANEASVNIWSHRGGHALFEAYLGELGGEEVHLQITKRLLACPNVDINARCEQEGRKTLLMLTAYFGESDLVDCILSNFPNAAVNCEDNQGNTALALAVARGHKTIVQRLLKHSRVMVDIRNREDETALDLAAKSKDPDMLGMLLSKVGNTLESMNDIDNAFFTAVEQGDSSLVQTFLRNDVHVNSFDRDKRNLLHAAAASGDATIVRMLLETPLDRNLQASRGETPLHEACRNGHLKVVVVLLSAKADTTIEDNAGRTPLVVARQNAWKMSYFRIMNLLGDNSPAGSKTNEHILSHLASLPSWSLGRIGLLDPFTERIAKKEDWDIMDRCPDTGNCAMHYAALYPRTKMLELLLSQGFDQRILNFDAQTPVHIAIQNNTKRRLETVELLLRYPHPPLELADKYGRRPLQLAQVLELFAIAVVLIEAGAELDPSDRTYLHPTFIEAVKLKRPHVVQLLIEKGADHLQPGKDGITARQIAKLNDDGETLQVLNTHKSFFIPVDVQRRGEANEDEDETTRDDEDVWQTPPTSPIGVHIIRPDLSKPKLVARVQPQK